MIHSTRDVIRLAQPHLQGAVLDLGAGTTKYKVMVLEQAKSYTALDLAVPANVVGSVEATPFAAASFDAILCSQVLEHVPRPWRVASEISRLLRSGGTCVVTAPFLIPYHADPHDYFRYTEEGLRHLFADAGFEILSSGAYGRGGMVAVEGLRHVFLSPYRGRTLPGEARLLRLLDKLGRWVDRICAPQPVYANVYLVARKA